jgi:nitroimidazol reductase NimA-like FMN-containing flavoprotein (pyridoxamine 5'-phosphate oxidase superfamily)
MNVNRDANGFVVLDRRACLELLAQHRVAALAITDHALPLVLPALYTLRGEDVLVGAASSGILGRRMPDSVVSMCVHDLDDDLLNGWTVTVTGLAEVVTSLADLTAVAELRRWGSAEASQVVVRVSTEHISGRLISTSPSS